MADEAKRGVGRPPHQPTDEKRRTVEAMAGYGVKHEDIALVIGIDDKTLRIHYRRELDLGKAKANASIGKRLFELAMEGHPAALIYWTKSQMKWSERQVIEVSGPEGGPVQVEATRKPIQQLLAESLAKVNGKASDEADES